MNELKEVLLEPGLRSALALIFTLLIYFVLNRGLKRLSTEGYMDFHLRIILQNALRFLLAVIVLLTFLSLFGISAGGFWATLSGVLALVAVGFVAVWSVLSNALCSILLILFPPFRIGDQIEILDTASEFSVRGKVTGINMFHTTLVMDSEDEPKEENILTVPNNIFFQKYIRRYKGETTQSLKKYVAHQVSAQEEQNQQ